MTNLLLKDKWDNNLNNKIKYDKLTFYFKSGDRITNLSQRSEEKWLYKLAEQKSTTNTLKMFYKGKEKVIKLFDYITTVSKAKYVAKHRKGHKILTPK